MEVVEVVCPRRGLTGAWSFRGTGTKASASGSWYFSTLRISVADCAGTFFHHVAILTSSGIGDSPLACFAFTSCTAQSK